MKINPEYLTTLLQGWKTYGVDYCPHYSKTSDKVLFFMILGRKAFKDNPEQFPSITLSYTTAVPMGADIDDYIQREQGSFSTGMSRLISNAQKEGKGKVLAQFRLAHYPPSYSNQVLTKGQPATTMLRVTKTYIPKPHDDQVMLALEDLGDLI